jgi:hypothetical protein
VDELAWLIEAFRTRYFDFTAKHFHEAIVIAAEPVAAARFLLP